MKNKSDRGQGTLKFPAKRLDEKKNILLKVEEILR